MVVAAPVSDLKEGTIAPELPPLVTMATSSNIIGVFAALIAEVAFELV